MNPFVKFYLAIGLLFALGMVIERMFQVRAGIRRATLPVALQIASIVITAVLWPIIAGGITTMVSDRIFTKPGKIDP
jgi:hypothetical protein